MKTLHALLVSSLFSPLWLFAQPASGPGTPPKPGPVVVHEIRYTGQLSETAARFTANLSLESTNNVATALTLFRGEVAVTKAQLPEGLRLTRLTDGYQMVVEQPGKYDVQLELLARIHKQDPFRQTQFTGPTATVGALAATVAGEAMELELLSGTPIPQADNNRASVRGALGADPKVNLRWRTRKVTQTRKALLIADTTSTIHLTPTVARHSTTLKYDILQGKPTNLTVQLPKAQSITKLDGKNIRDWRVETAGESQTLTIEFVQPAEKAYTLGLLTEQSLVDGGASLQPAQPLNIERESGRLTLTAEDVMVDTQTTGLRKANVAAGQVGTWQFFSRDNFNLSVTTSRIEPVVNVFQQLHAHQGDTRLQYAFTVTLTVAKAGIYSLHLGNPALLAGDDAFTVSNVTSTGLDDWKIDPDTGLIHLQYQSRILGQRPVTVILEKPGSADSFTMVPLSASPGEKEPFAVGTQRAQVNVRGAAGMELRKGETQNTRDIAAGLGTLAFQALQPDWSVAVNVNKLEARVTAEVFNLVTFGDGLLGGTTTLRYGIVNQGVETFRVRVPDDWKNVQFIGANIRRSENSANAEANAVDWTITLQEKVWNGYTLVVSYDDQYSADQEAHQRSLRGAHPLDVERETGTLAITGASNLQIATGLDKAEGLIAIDPSELPKADFDLVNRPILSSFRYTGDTFSLPVSLKRLDAEQVLDAVSDRTQIVTQITPTGEMVTEAQFMLKNNGKQEQYFTMPAKASNISTSINNAEVKPQKAEDGRLRLPLPKGLNRNKPIHVKITYSQKMDALRTEGAMTGLSPVQINLAAPKSDIPNTYNEWTVYLEDSRYELFNFDGTMIVAGQHSYRWADAWYKFRRNLQRTQWGPVVGLFVLVGIAMGLFNLGRRRGGKALLWGGLGIGGMALGLALLLPAVDRMKNAYPTSYAQNAAEYEYATEEKSDGWKHAAGGEADSENFEGADPSMGPMEGSDESGDGGSKPRQPQKTEASEPAPTTPAETPNPAPPGGGAPGPDTTSPGGGGGFPGANNSGTPADPATDPGRGRNDDQSRANASGMKPVSYHVSQSGRAFLFTKILSEENETLKISALSMDAVKRKVRRGLFQSLILLAGLWVLWTQWRSEERSTLTVSIGLATIYGALLSLFYYEHQLDQLWGATLYGVGFALLVWIIWFFWPPKPALASATPNLDPETETDMSTDLETPQENNEDNDKPPTGTSTGGGTAAALILFLGLQSTVGAQPAAPSAAPGTPDQIRQTLIELLTPKPTGPRVISEAQVQDRNGTRYAVNEDMPFAGTVVGHFANKQKRIESQYLAGQLHGNVTTWYDNGQKQSLSRHQKGQLHGVRETWHRNGQAATATPYANDQRQGAHREWDQHGKLRVETPYQKGELHGLARVWHANGRIAREVRWENGRQLSFDTWDEKGSRSDEALAAATITQAQYQVTIHPNVAVVEATYQITSRRDDQKVTLFAQQLAIDTFSCTQANAQLRREGPALVLQLPQTGNAEAKVKFLVKHSGTVAERKLAVGIPPSLTTEVKTVLNETGAEISVPQAVLESTEEAANQTTHTATLAAATQLDLHWKPRVKQAQEIAATVFARNASLISFQRGLVRTRTQIDYNVTQGELRRARVQLPASHKLMRVTATDGSPWFVEEIDGNNILVVDLTKPANQAWQLTLETENALAAPPVMQAVQVPKVLDVKRENGLLGLLGQDDLSVSVDPAQTNGLTKKNVEEFTKVVPKTAPTSVFSYLNTYTLNAGVAAVLPQVEAVAKHHFHVGSDVLNLTTHVDYNIKKTGIFQLALALPDGFQVNRVHGANIARTNHVDGRLELTLSQRTLGFYGLRVDLQKLQPLAESIPVTGVHPLGTEKITGYLAVGAEPGLELKAEDVQNIAEIPSNELPSRSPNAPGHAFGAPVVTMPATVLAFRHITPMPGDTLGWSLNVVPEQLDPWIRAEVTNHLNVRQSHISGLTKIRYEIVNAPTRQFVIRVPEKFRNVQFVGANLRSQDQDADDSELWTVTLQNKTMGTYTLTLAWDWADWAMEINPDQESSKPFTFTGPRVQGTQMPQGQEDQAVDPQVERETGYLTVTITDKTPLQIERTTVEGSGETIKPLDPANLPEHCQLSNPPVLAYQYLRPGYSLPLKVNRFLDHSVLRTLIQSAHFVSSVGEDGQMLTQATLQILNNGGQFLQLNLPNKNDRIWSAFIGGRAVLPTKNASGGYSLPLEQSTGNIPFTLEFTYRSGGTGAFPKAAGSMTMLSPSFDVPLQDAHWQMFLPVDYRYRKFTGTMTRATQPPSRRTQHPVMAMTAQPDYRRAAGPVNTRFDSTAYERQEFEQESRVQRSFDYNLDNVSSNIQAGNLNEANRFLGQALSQVEGNPNAGRYKTLEQQIRKAQAANQIRAQREYSFRNSQSYYPGNANPGSQQAESQTAPEVLFDERTAEQQVAEVQKAQRLTEQHIAPLRINIPERGRFYSFSQSSQMETKKAMEVKFEVVNTRETQWGRTLAGVAAALAALFGLVTLTRYGLRARCCARNIEESQSSQSVDA